MDLFEAIAKRQTYRGSFKKTVVPVPDLRKIVEAGCAAPSGKNGQTTTFVVVDQWITLSAMKKVLPDRPDIQTAEAFIACVVDIDPPATYEGFNFSLEDCAAAVENMMLAITALGYATVWLDGMLRLKDRAAHLAEILAIPQGKKIQILLPIGVPAEEYSRPEKKPFEERAWFNVYGV